MKKVLLITYNSIYPLMHGGALAQYYFIDGLKDRVQFILCTEVKNEKSLNELEELRRKLPSLKIYFLNSVLNPNNLSIKSRIKRIIKQFWKTFQNKINKLTPKLPNTDDFNDTYFEHVDNMHNNKFIELINDVIENEGISQIQFDFYDTIDLCWAVPENIHKIFIHHELRFKRLKLAFNKSPLLPQYKNYLIEKTELFERSCIRKMDEVVVFNENDAALLSLDAQKVTVSPFGITDELIFKQKICKNYSKLLFVGGESHTPNMLGLIWFLDQIYLPNNNEINFPLLIVGDWSREFINKYKSQPSIIFCGIVETIEPYFKSSIFVNPIITGAGLRTKVLHAFVNKVPVLSTRFGAEGCYSQEDHSHLGLFDTAEEFLTIINTLDFKWLSYEGFNYYNQSFNREKLLNIRYNIYN